jgi:hypothetical protein
LWFVFAKTFLIRHEITSRHRSNAVTSTAFHRHFPETGKEQWLIGQRRSGRAENQAFWFWAVSAVSWMLLFTLQPLSVTCQNIH